MYLLQMEMFAKNVSWLHRPHVRRYFYTLKLHNFMASKGAKLKYFDGRCLVDIVCHRHCHTVIVVPNLVFNGWNIVQYEVNMMQYHGMCRSIILTCIADVLSHLNYQEDLNLPVPGQTSFWSVHDSFRAGGGVGFHGIFRLVWLDDCLPP